MGAEMGLVIFGREKAAAADDWQRRLGYSVLGEMHIPGRLRIWHVIKELRRLRLWRNLPLKVLDAGGGEGSFAYFVARRFPRWSVAVADNEPSTLDRGRRIKSALGLHNLEVRELDILRMDDASAYDIVVCSDVLEHVDDDQRAVHNLARALKPGGFLILTSPSLPQPKHLPLVAWRERRIGFSLAHYGHVRQGYSAEDLSRLLRAAGVEVNRIRWTFGRFGTLMFDLFFLTGDSRPNAAVYAALLPLYLALSALDIAFPVRQGAGILAVGRKP